MNPVNCKINDLEVSIESGMTILEAAQTVRTSIPTMCYLKDNEQFTSCMICVVEEKKSGRLLPSCSARAEDGMIIETDSAAVRAARKTALELLMSDHIGDCEAPCHRSCPAHMNIPEMLKKIGNKHYRNAYIKNITKIFLRSKTRN